MARVCEVATVGAEFLGDGEGDGDGDGDGEAVGDGEGSVITAGAVTTGATTVFVFSVAAEVVRPRRL